MSLLSSTQGTPERVWSLLAALSANGGVLERSQAAELLNPGFTRDDKIVREKPDTFGQVLGAATSLGAVVTDGPTLRLSSSCTVEDYTTFCNWVHAHLVTLDSEKKDAVILETYAWIAAESDRQGSIGWVHDWNANTFADAADKALPDEADDDGARRMNSTKLPPWRRWLVCLGLMVPMPLSIRQHPSVDVRATLELAYLDLLRETEIDADDFLKALAVRLPYIDGGRMFLDATKRIGHAPVPRQLSPLLSRTLRNLHDEGTIELRVQGDASGLVRLSANGTHKMQSFHAVVMKDRVNE